MWTSGFFAQFALGPLVVLNYDNSPSRHSARMGTDRAQVQRHGRRTWSALARAKKSGDVEKIMERAKNCTIMILAVGDQPAEIFGQSGYIIGATSTAALTRAPTCPAFSAARVPRTPTWMTITGNGSTRCPRRSQSIAAATGSTSMAFPGRRAASALVSSPKAVATVGRLIPYCGRRHQQARFVFRRVRQEERARDRLRTEGRPRRALQRLGATGRAADGLYFGPFGP